MVIGRINDPIQTYPGVVLIVFQKTGDILVLFQNNKLIQIDKSDPSRMIMHIVETVHIRFYLRRIGNVAIDDFHNSFSDVRL